MKPTAIRTLTHVSAALLVLFAFTAPSSAEDNAIRDYWIEQWHGLQEQKQELTRQLEEARIEFRHGRRANRGRGDERAEVLERIARLEGELAIAEEELAAFPEKARKAGALPGWFRDDGPRASRPASGDSVASP